MEDRLKIKEMLDSLRGDGMTETSINFSHELLEKLVNETQTCEDTNSVKFAVDATLHILEHIIQNAPNSVAKLGVVLYAVEILSEASDMKTSIDNDLGHMDRVH